MTPEQNDQWKAAVGGENNWKSIFALASLLPCSENPDLFQASERYWFLEQQRWKAIKRLASWGIPCFATHLWSHCAHKGWGRPWGLRFVQSAEVALAGLQILYPERALGAPVYQRLLVRFLHNALKPLAEDVEQKSEWRRQELASFLAFSELFSNPNLPPLADWQTVQLALVHQLEDETLYSRGSLIQCYQCGEIAQAIFFEQHGSWWEAVGEHLGHEMTNLYSSSALRYALRDYSANDMHPIADAYLTALESECPPPDWLPRT